MTRTLISFHLSSIFDCSYGAFLIRVDASDDDMKSVKSASRYVFLCLYIFYIDTLIYCSVTSRPRPRAVSKSKPSKAIDRAEDDA